MLILDATRKRPRGWWRLIVLLQIFACWLSHGLPPLRCWKSNNMLPATLSYCDDLHLRKGTFAGISLALTLAVGKGLHVPV